MAMQAQPQGQGGDPMQDALAGLMSQADSMEQGAQSLGEAGAPKGAVDKLMQAAQLMRAALSELGVGEAPGQPSAEMVAPEVA